MKLNALIAPVLGVALLVGCVSEQKKQAQLEAEAKISRAEAEKVALAKAPNGTIKEGELEKEKGLLVWSFDITTPGSKDIKEVQVNAMTGEFVSEETESAEHEAKEKEDGKKE